mmetsp:Transcript_12569/g.25092  ORF Transcript_12569/g.25092 Transcript_12569/m.25092 type:complete len:323 (-) Transcript_12569:17-985(-)
MLLPGPLGRRGVRRRSRTQERSGLFRRGAGRRPPPTVCGGSPRHLLAARREQVRHRRAEPNIVPRLVAQLPQTEPGAEPETVPPHAARLVPAGGEGGGVHPPQRPVRVGREARCPQIQRLGHGLLHHVRLHTVERRVRLPAAAVAPPAEMEEGVVFRHRRHRLAPRGPRQLHFQAHLHELLVRAERPHAPGGRGVEARLQLPDAPEGRLHVRGGGAVVPLHEPVASVLGAVVRVLCLVAFIVTGFGVTVVEAVFLRVVAILVGVVVGFFVRHRVSLRTRRVQNVPAVGGVVRVCAGWSLVGRHGMNVDQPTGFLLLVYLIKS